MLAPATTACVPIFPMSHPLTAMWALLLHPVIAYRWRCGQQASRHKTRWW